MSQRIDVVKVLLVCVAYVCATAAVMVTGLVLCSRGGR